MSAARAGGLYFVLVFAAGAMLGPFREFVIRPRLGAVGSTAVEAPLMLAVIWAAARFVVGRLGDEPGLTARATIGGVAFVALMIAECAGSLVLRQMTLSEWLAHFAKADGALSLALFLAFALMPIVVRGSA